MDGDVVWVPAVGGFPNSGTASKNRMVVSGIVSNPVSFKDMCGPSPPPPPPPLLSQRVHATKGTSSRLKFKQAMNKQRSNKNQKNQKRPKPHKQRM